MIVYFAVFNEVILVISNNQLLMSEQLFVVYIKKVIISLKERKYGFIKTFLHTLPPKIYKQKYHDTLE